MTCLSNVCHSTDDQFNIQWLCARDAKFISFGLQPALLQMQKATLLQYDPKMTLKGYQCP